MRRSPGARVLGALPHVLSGARVLLVGAAHWAVFNGDTPLFATLVVLAVLTDVLDGPLARAYATASRFGANVDSASDLLFYLSLPVWVWEYRPEIVIDHAVTIAVFLVLYLVANFTSGRVLGALGVHNRLSRASATAGVFFALYSILWGFESILYYALILLLAADLAQRYGGLLRAWRARRGGGGSGPGGGGRGGGGSAARRAGAQVEAETGKEARAGIRGRKAQTRGPPMGAAWG